MTERMQRFLPLAKHLGEEEDGNSLMAMLLDDFYQETFYGSHELAPSQEGETSGGRSRRPDVRSGKGQGRKTGKSGSQSRDRRKNR